MKLIIFLICFIYILSLTSNYYKKCSSGVEYIDIVSVSSCRQYDNDGGYCCYLTYDNPKEKYDIPIYLPPYYRNKNENKTKLRTLQEPKYYCYGISKSGYDNIDDVIDELKDETGIPEMKIDCDGYGLKNSLLNLFYLLFIVIIL